MNRILNIETTRIRSEIEIETFLHCESGKNVFFLQNINSRAL